MQPTRRQVEPDAASYEEAGADVAIDFVYREGLCPPLFYITGVVALNMSAMTRGVKLMIRLAWLWFKTHDPLRLPLAYCASRLRRLFFGGLSLQCPSF